MESGKQNMKGYSAYLFEKAENCTDLFEAHKLYKEAAKLGDAGAQCKLGMSFFLGVGVEKDMSEAEHWLRKSAKNDDAGGQYALGSFYFNNAENSNIDGAIYWLEKAVKQGHNEAADALHMVKLQREASENYLKNHF